jgi:hypothetical protein
VTLSDSESLGTKTAGLQDKIKRFLDYSWRMHRLYSWLNFVIVLLGVGLGASITLVGGAFHSGTGAAVLGALTSVLLGVQNLFQFAEKSNVWQIKHNDAKAIRDCLQFKTNSEAEFQAQVDAWLALKKGLLDDMPRAEGLGRQTDHSVTPGQP